MTIQALADQMNVSQSDVIGFISILRHHLDQGMTFDQALAAHASNIGKMTKSFAANHERVIEAIKPLAVEWFA